MRFFIHKFCTIQTPDQLDPGLEKLLAESFECDWSRYLQEVKRNMAFVEEVMDGDARLYIHLKYLDPWRGKIEIT